MNEPEPVLICHSCSFALGDSPIAVADHLAENYGALKSDTKELRHILRPNTFIELDALRLRPDRSAPHPHLRLQAGVACRYCNFRTTSSEVVSRHGVERKPSTWLQDHVVSGLLLQSWEWHSAARYWTVKPDSSPAQALDNSLLQDSVPRPSRSEALHCTPWKFWRPLLHTHLRFTYCGFAVRVKKSRYCLWLPPIVFGRPIASPRPLPLCSVPSSNGFRRSLLQRIVLRSKVV